MRWEILDTCGDPVGIERVGGNDTVDLMVTEQGRQSAASLTPALCRQLGNELLKAANEMTPNVDPVTLPDADDGPLGAEVAQPYLPFGNLEDHDYFIAIVDNYKAIDEDTAKALNQVGLGVSGTKPLAMVFAASLYLAYKIPHYEGANPLASTTRRVTLNLDNVKGLVYETWLHPRSKTS